MKKEIRVIGIDDGPFKKFSKGKVLVIGTIFRGGISLDGVLSAKVAIDGNDSTKNLARMINKCKFKPQLQAILLNGISVAGFNVIDIKALGKKTKLPVIVVIRRYPDFKTIKSTLEKIGQKNKYKLMEIAGRVHKHKKVCFQAAGISLKDAKEILNITTTRSFIPEPIRIAHLIASGIVDGQSRGRA